MASRSRPDELEQHVKPHIEEDRGLHQKHQVKRRAERAPRKIEREEQTRKEALGREPERERNPLSRPAEEGGTGYRSCLRKTLGFRNGLKSDGRLGSNIHRKRELGCGRRRIRDGTPASALRRSSATSLNLKLALRPGWELPVGTLNGAYFRT